MNRGLSRRRARISLVLFAVGLLGLLAGMVRDGWFTTGIGVVFCFGGILLRPSGCPGCGRKVSPLPQWSEAGKYHCPHCGSRLAYDDEKPEE